MYTKFQLNRSMHSEFMGKMQSLQMKENNNNDLNHH